MGKTSKEASSFFIKLLPNALFQLCRLWWVSLKLGSVTQLLHFSIPCTVSFNHVIDELFSLLHACNVVFIWFLFSPSFLLYRFLKESPTVHFLKTLLCKSSSWLNELFNVSFLLITNHACLCHYFAADKIACIFDSIPGLSDVLPICDLLPRSHTHNWDPK